jgi:hypothetical protein
VEEEEEEERRSVNCAQVEEYAIARLQIFNLLNEILLLHILYQL